MLTSIPTLRKAILAIILMVIASPAMAPAAAALAAGNNGIVKVKNVYGFDDTISRQ